MPPNDTARSTSILGFDIAIYPGDVALTAWRYPASPFRWIGYYLAAPCRRDSSWVGKRATVTSNGWGVAAIYVGQQDWSQHARPAATTHVAADSQASLPSQTQSAGPCSASLLSSTQGAREAVDAIAKMRAEGFPDGSVVFLDVELVTTLTPALLAYYQAWLAGVLADGHYRPGVYAAKANAQLLHDSAAVTYRHSNRSDTPPFWIASVAGFAQTMRPSDVGFSFAQLWQGQVGVLQSFNGVPLNIDVNLSTLRDPSAP
jgi:hypothetical protein